MKKLVFAAFLFLATPGLATPSRTEASRVDARAFAALEHCAQSYQTLKSFSVGVTETLEMNGKQKARAAFSGSFGLPSRAIFRSHGDESATFLMVGDVRHIIEDGGVLFDPLDEDVPGAALREIRERIEPSRGLSELIDILKNGRGFLRKSDGVKLRIFYGATPDGGEKIHVLESPPRHGLTSASLSYFLAPKTRFLQRIERTKQIQATRMSLVSRFSTPRSNWRGSWEKTDAAIYNSQVVFGFQSEAEASAKPILKIAPEARELFERAAQLYGRAKTVSLVWNERSSMGDKKRVTIRVDFERPSRLRIQIEPASRLYLATEAAQWRRSTEFFADEKWHYIREKPPIDPLKTDHDPSWGLMFVLPFLQGEHYFSEKSLGQSAMFVEIAAARLPDATQNGQSYARARLFRKFRWGYENIINSSVYWFAPDGSLVRVDEEVVEAGRFRVRDSGYIVEQKLDSPIDASRFQFILPPDSVLGTR